MKWASTLTMTVAALALATTAFGQTSGSAASGANATNSLGIPSNQGIVTKLLTDLDAGRNKAGDLVEAETSRDIKNGKQVLLKKGTILTGHVTKVQAHASSDEPSLIGIVFDSATPKGGRPESIRLGLEALAPAPSAPGDTDMKGGRGMTETQLKATVAGQVGEPTSANLSPDSVGVYGYRGLNLAAEEDKGTHVSLVLSRLGGVQVKKGSQMVFKPIGQ